MTLKAFHFQIDSDKKSKVNAYIFCRNSDDHVYYGTYDTCVRGNGYTAKAMDSNETLCVFNRYN